MNKIDLFFAKHMWLTYVLGFVIVPLLIGNVSLGLFDFYDAWQYAGIFSFIYGLFFLGPRIKKYKEFNNQKQMENSTND